MDRRLTVIMAADVVGYSRLMEADEESTVAALNDKKEIIAELVNSYNGRMFGTAGDSIMVEFARPTEAVGCAIEIQKKINASNIDVPDSLQMFFRIGINLGDVIVDGENLFGDGVNIAARLESNANTGGINISSSVHSQVETKFDREFAEIGDQHFKNISRPIKVYRWVQNEEDSAAGDTHLPRQSISRKPSIAVLPFNNMSGDQGFDYFCDGMTEDIITALSKTRWLSVTARNSTFVYKNQSVDIRKVAKDLSVDYVLEGSVRKSERRLRINAQLIEGETGEHAWAEIFNRKFDDEFEAQDECVQQISTILLERIWQVAAKNVTKKTPDNYDALDLIVLGLPLVHTLDPVSTAKAIDYLFKALSIDDKITLGHLGIGFSYLINWMHWDDPSGEALEKAANHAQKMLEIAPEDASTYRLLSRVMIAKGKFEEATEYVERALRINPHDGDIIGNKGVVQMFMGNFKEAFTWFDQVLDLHADTPHTVDIMNYWKALVHFMSKDYKASLRSLNSVSGLAYVKTLLSGASYAMLGDEQIASKNAAAVLKLRPNLMTSDIKLADCFSDRDHCQHLRNAFKQSGIPS